MWDVKGITPVIERKCFGRLLVEPFDIPIHSIHCVRVFDNGIEESSNETSANRLDS